MKIAGIVAEYNPFHTGHEYHIRATRARTGCDYVVCALGGAFTQRGEPAILDKYARVECALSAGADAVFELPGMYSIMPAQLFARGGAGVLNALGADYISFGCEPVICDTDALEFIRRASALMDEEPPALSEAVRAGLGAGKSHARARGEAVSSALGVRADALNRPNLILAIEYLRAINALGSQMIPVAIPRASDYHARALAPRADGAQYEDSFNETDGLPETGGAPFASATALRRAILEGRLGEALAYVPAPVKHIIAREAVNGIARPEALDNILLYKLRALTADEAAALPDAGEGLGERVRARAQVCASRAELIESVKCKRYTYARISRVLAYALTGLTRAQAQNAPAPRARLLGMRAGAGELVKELKRRAGDKLISDPAKLEGGALFEFEKRLTDLWGLATQNPEYRRAGRERTQKFIVL